MFRAADAAAAGAEESTARVAPRNLIGAIPPAPGGAAPVVDGDAAPPTGPAMPTVPAAPTVVPPVAAPAASAPAVSIPAVSIPAFVPTLLGSPPRTPPTGAAGPPVALLWQLTLADGQVIPVTGSIVLGRDPAPVTRRAATMVSVIDPAKSVSKSHALVELVAGELWVTDLHSTNGVSSCDADGRRTPLDPGVRTAVTAGVSLSLGEFAVRVSQA